MLDVERSQASDSSSSQKQPLIAFARNRWTRHPEPEMSRNSPKIKGGGRRPRWTDFVLAVVSTPRFKRYVAIYLVLLCMTWAGWVGIVSPRLVERKGLIKAMDTRNRDRVGGWFGSNALPEFLDMIHVRSLESYLVPGPEPLSSGDPDRRRLVMIGDVNGCSDELERMLKKVSFNEREGDHLIFTGDLIGGPNSADVVQLARKHRASCVRGNVEDRVLLTRRQIAETAITGFGSPVRRSKRAVEETPSQSDSRERILAQELSDADAEWLDACPVILKVGQIENMGEVVVVHAGLVPGLSLEKQDPTTAFTMRTIDADTHTPSSSSAGMNWAKFFNKYQETLAASQIASPAADASSTEPTTVIHGHDPNRSPSLKTYTKGLDTGCIRGGKLTAFVIEDGGNTYIEQIRCRDYTGKSGGWANLPFL